ncbi:hypothetical protein F5Y18DRAFT_416309 [Xylariaceae sp. FL1019]|nr:hypothetical protein F5Y18DRAFT_416309 [Xylariaceae sp. FL1019]
MTTAEVLIQPAWCSTDDESLSTILELLVGDAQDVIENSKGKQAEGVLSDADLAWQLFTEELDTASLYASDRRMTKSIQDAVRSDQPALVELEQEERTATNDRELVAALSAGRTEDGAQEPVELGPSAAELEIWEKLDALYITGVHDYPSDDDTDDVEISDTDTIVPNQPESSSWAATRKSKRSSQRRKCLACCNIKHFTDLARVPCGHEYCRDCLQHLFRDAMTDESLFPPRCCRQSIPVETNRLFLPAGLIHQFKAKSVEFSTPNRTYCHRPTCSMFIPLQNIDEGVAQCGSCGERSCSTCKGAAHQGDCPFDQELHRVLQIARQERWQRCPKCYTMIQLEFGCFHMTCKCQAQFCYLCGTPWKNCDCAQWDEHRLLARAEEIYDRDHDGERGDDNEPEVNDDLGIVNNERPDILPGEVHDEGNEVIPVDVVPAAPRRRATAREEGIDRIMQNLLANHECDHDRWKGRGGPRRCEECGHVMPIFIYECRQCNIMACRRCRYHRL